jgi:hypothetical protein
MVTDLPGEDDVEGEAEQECPTCGGEGTIEIDNRSSCRRPISDCCGGCYDYAPCPDCGEEPPEPDWDAIRKERLEEPVDYNDEVDWESPI